MREIGLSLRSSRTTGPALGGKRSTREMRRTKARIGRNSKIGRKHGSPRMRWRGSGFGDYVRLPKPAIRSQPDKTVSRPIALGADATSSSHSPLSKSTSTACRSGFTESARCTPGPRRRRSSCPNFAMATACGERRLLRRKKFTLRSPERCSMSLVERGLTADPRRMTAGCRRPGCTGAMSRKAARVCHLEKIATSDPSS
jgi:hypothetical protein